MTNRSPSSGLLTSICHLLFVICHLRENPCQLAGGLPEVLFGEEAVFKSGMVVDYFQCERQTALLLEIFHASPRNGPDAVDFTDLLDGNDLFPQARLSKQFPSQRHAGIPSKKDPCARIAGIVSEPALQGAFHEPAGNAVESLVPLEFVGIHQELPSDEFLDLDGQRFELVLARARNPDLFLEHT